MKRLKLGAILCIALTAIMPINALAADVRASETFSIGVQDESFFEGEIYDEELDQSESDVDDTYVDEEDETSGEFEDASSQGLAVEDSTSEVNQADEVDNIDDAIQGDETDNADDVGQVAENDNSDEADAVDNADQIDDATVELESSLLEVEIDDEDSDEDDVIEISLDEDVDAYMLGSPTRDQLLFGDDVLELDADEEVEVSYGSTTSVIRANMTYGQTEARTILAMINDFRTDSSSAWYWDSSNTSKIYANNLSPLTYDYTLEKVAMQRAAECAIAFDHTRPNGNSCWTAYSECGYTVTYVMRGENIAAGYSSAASVFEGWKEDDCNYSGQGHRRNMLNSSYTAVGIGHVYFNGTHYWVQEFSSVNQTPTATVANDKSTSVSVEVLNSEITVYGVTNDVLLEVNSSYSLKSEGTTFRHSETWPSSRKITTTSVVPSYSLSDTSYASISNGIITGKKLGTCKLTSTYFNGQTTTRNVQIKNHNYVETTVEGTCTTQGYVKRECSICHDSSTTLTGTTGHNYYDYIYYSASSSSSGLIRRNCRKCGYYYYDTIPVNYTGLIQLNGDWCYFKNGVRNTSYTGLVQYNGTWYYVQSGILKWGYNGLVQYNGTWYYVQNSTLKWGYNGLVQYNGTWYYVQNSTLKWGYNGLVQYNGTWYYVQNSTLKWGYNTLVLYNGSWYYVQNSTLKWGVNTCVSYNGAWYYVKNSTVDFSYNGYTTYNGVRYKVVNGVLQV